MKPLRKCRVCGLEAHTQQELLLFVRDTTRKHNTRAKCNSCNNKEVYLKRKTNKIKALKYLGNKCVNCGLAYNGENEVVFDFHHTDPSTKEGKPTKLLCFSWEALKKEIDKCTLLCSNCHRMEHKKENEC